MNDRKLRHTRIYEQVVEELKELISSGELQPGDPLPPERQMMAQMGVSRSSLREAFRVMELLGLIDSVPGKGRFVRKPRGETADSRNMPLEDEAVLELMEARRVLDPAIAATAAMHSTPSDLMKLRKVLSRTEKNLEKIELRSQSDFDFHLALAESTHNFVFINIVKMTFNLIMATHERIYSLLADKEAFLKEHQDIYDAIIDHDVARAQEISAGHIERVYKTLQEALALEVK
ncbi:MAG TPA: FadR family transcriptional regulator [Synergistetes bacterium]|nr:FadR family transcriptional regulator [Synergistota bacterium]